MKTLSFLIARSLLLVVIVVVLTNASQVVSRNVVASGQQQETKEERELRVKRERDQKQTDAQRNRDANNRDKNSKQFNDLAKFADDFYERDATFREAVDAVYLNLQSQQAIQAYRINTLRANELSYAETEDRMLTVRRVLYDNPWVQDYVNRVGQRLVPDDSDKLYAFKVTYHPIPYAYTMSTGTILISTGMISLLDNEAQLAYILAHEMAHVYNDDWKLKVKMPLAQQEFNLQQQKKNFVMDVLARTAADMAQKQGGAQAGVATGLVISSLLDAYLNQRIGVDWETVQEDKADELALKTVLERSYDTKEVPKLFLVMDNASRFDERTQLGFLGKRERLKQRREYAERAFTGPMGSTYQELLKAGKLVGNTPEFSRVMADLKRDNGIEAFRFDMFQMARKNLGEAVALRSDDARATFYYGRVLKLVGRTPEELAQANSLIARAISLDGSRAGIPEAQLQRALMLMQEGSQASQGQALQALKDYITTFQKHKAEMADSWASLPANIEVLYDFIQMLGDRNWKAGSFDTRVQPTSQPTVNPTRTEPTTPAAPATPPKKGRP